jgi:hypothetical protein
MSVSILYRVSIKMGGFEEEYNAHRHVQSNYNAHDFV